MGVKLEDDVDRLKIVPLATVFPGRKVRIVSLLAGGGLQRHLIDMGLNIGSEVEVISSIRRGPVLIVCGETRLMIGFGMAKKIMVDSINYEEE
ncbi:MAG: FeoA family protein [Campylobacterota bacterium]|nr:FeoA family protein [Campylobacterota bacterium]